MRRHSIPTLSLVLFVLALATVAMAANPLVGAWKMNVARSKLSPIMLAANNLQDLKEETEVYREIEGDQIELTWTGIMRTGASVSETVQQRIGLRRAPPGFPWHRSRFGRR